MLKNNFVVFAFVFFALVVAVASAINYNLEFTLEESILGQGVLSGDEEIAVRNDLISAGYDFYEGEYSVEEIRNIIHEMKESNGNYEADWDWIWQEVLCFEDWWYNEREPGEIFQDQGGQIYSYCLPSGQPPYDARVINGAPSLGGLQ